MSYVIFFRKCSMVVICLRSLNLWVLCLKLYISWLTILLSPIIYHLGKFWSSSILSPHRNSLLIRLPRNNCPNSKIKFIHFALETFILASFSLHCRPHPSSQTYTRTQTHKHTHIRTRTYTHTHVRMHTITHTHFFALFLPLYFSLYTPSISLPVYLFLSLYNAVYVFWVWPE